MSTSRKKAIVRRLDGTTLHGYLPASGLLTGDDLEVLQPDGRVALLALAEVKYVAYVKDFNLDDPIDPERLGPRILTAKPRGPGLWVRLNLIDGDVMDGLLHAGLSFLDGLLLDRGLFLTVAEKHSNTQRLFVPRSSLSEFQVLGATGASSKTAQRATPATQPQAGLFDE